MYQDGSFSEGYAIGRDTNNNNGWGNDGAWWIIILLALFGGWGNGFGGNNFGGNLAAYPLPWLRHPTPFYCRCES